MNRTLFNLHIRYNRALCSPLAIGIHLKGIRRDKDVIMSFAESHNMIVKFGSLYFNEV